MMTMVLICLNVVTLRSAELNRLRFGDMHVQILRYSNS